MAYIARPDDFIGRLVAAPGTAQQRPGLLRRVYRAFMVSRARRANRDLAAFFEHAGGRLTDDLEREMMRRLTGGDWNLRR